ncbi:ImmA/IrrE family metallo-endopeptidase [Blautia producta]|uniref:ImmA/IrrE family metallo-endopeptidase n=3 Tax=Blautia producta TaxID=33035 RepID=A0A7G5N1H0_9FIRM|nr:ImmA/IrrE family metallo-endopeptidase [Blautia producta]QIB56513.1 ImmA/IrrE family metallo-endopeptidase [Blautia producta ATCC 27340 = DSM 2950]QMW80713.1 ImmA/IrrE family metallo-endopeptidase [Blautia producta]
MGEIEQIKCLIAYYKKKFGTNDPFVIADNLNVLYQIGNCRHEGYYMFLKNHRYIFLSNKLEDIESKVVMSHELAHAIYDRKENCYFIRNRTLLLNSKSERRANRFAAYLLIDDEMLREFSGYTREQFCQCTGYPMELIELRLK